MVAAIRRLASKFFSLANKELSVLKELHGEVQATLARFEERNPGFGELLEDAHGYVVFPSIGKATAVIGAAFGKGEVLRNKRVVGYAGVGQLTLGLQLGGQTFSQVVVLRDKAAFDRFKAGRFAFAANASAVLVKAGAAASVDYDRGAAVFVLSEGGMMLEAAIGAQKFFFRPAVLGRTRKAAPPKPAAEKPAPAKKAKRPTSANARRPGAQNREPAPTTKSAPRSRHPSRAAAGK